MKRLATSALTALLLVFLFLVSDQVLVLAFFLLCCVVACRQ